MRRKEYTKQTINHTLINVPTEKQIKLSLILKICREVIRCE